MKLCDLPSRLCICPSRFRSEKQSRFEQRRRFGIRRGAALYSLTVSTALIVSLLGVASLAVTRVQRTQTSETMDVIQAQALARSAVEFATTQINQNEDWRTENTSGVESKSIALDGGAGSFTWIIQDSDGSLTDDDTELSIVGIGRQNLSTQVYRVQLQTGFDISNEQELNSEDDEKGAKKSNLKSNEWFAQYIEPNLPNDAISWWVDRFELHCEKKNGGRDFELAIYLAESSGYPSNTIVDSLNLNSNDLSSNREWHNFQFNETVELAPDQAICIALQTTDSGTPVEFSRTDKNSNTAEKLIKGNPSWHQIEENWTMIYRLHGYYKTPNNEVHAIEGGWRTTSSP